MIDLSPYDAILLDLDGTLYREDHALPGAADLIARLAGQRRNFACLSNTTNSPQRVRARLLRMGMDVPAERIYTAAAATCDYVLQHFGSNADAGQLPRVFNLATEGVHDLLDGRVRWVQSADEPCDAIVVGAPSNLYATEERQLIAVGLLRQGAALLGICADRVFPSPRGLEIGTGAFSHMLAYAANVKPTFCGKPERIFFEELCQLLGVAPSRCLLIGDNLESDVAGAKKVGMRTVLTLTGVTQRQDLQNISPELRPEVVIDDLRRLAD